MIAVPESISNNLRQCILCVIISGGKAICGD